ncbi:MAG: FecR domain-containing protein [Polyangiaceae bacterium]|nr:FecR domain-containing protein [Polyangiaceae bacterium]
MSEKPQQSPKAKTIQRVVLALLALAVIGSVIAYVVTRRPPPVRAGAIQARLELAAGEVTVDQGEGAVRAASGAPLKSGARIETGKGARALVRLPDGSRLFLRDDSVAVLGAESVVLEKGEYFVDAPPTDREALAHTAGEIVVAAADAGLSVRRDGEGAVVYVARGAATVTSKGGRVEVKAGEQALARGADKPEVAPLSFWDDWTGGMADYSSGALLAGAGRGTIYGVDVGAQAGSPARRLEVSKQSVRAVVREGLSETEVDQTFFNPTDRAVEGWYWFTLPERASVTGFALETDGQLVEGELTERREAAAKYATAVATGHSPAILEWIDNRTYRARIYPITSGGTRRVVLRYLELTTPVDGKLTYVYPMSAGDPVRIGEFSLSVSLGEPGQKMRLATLADARVEDGGKRVTMRRSGYTPRTDFQLEATLPGSRPPLTVSRYAAGGESADYLMVRYVPDIDWKSVKQQRADVVVVVDTSAAGDEAGHKLKSATAQAILRGLSSDDRFALVALDVRPKVLHPKDGLAAASDKEIEQALEALADHSVGGATDLEASFDVALARLHGAEQPALVYVGDGLATSGVMTGEQLIERLRRALGTSRARLFSVGVGTDAAHALLGELARAGGGIPLRVDEAEQTTARALELAAAIKTPTLTDLELDLGAGLDEPFSTAAGKVSRGSEVVVLARTHHDLPRKVTVRGRLGGEKFEKEYDVKRDDSVVGAFVPRLWAAEYVRRLLGAAPDPEQERGRIVALGLEYGLMTPFTSFIALESESAYQRMGIPRRRSPLRGVKLGALDPTSERRLTARLAAMPAASLPLGCSKLDRLAASESEPASAPQAAGAKEYAPSPIAQQAEALEEKGDLPQEPTPAPSLIPEPESVAPPSNPFTPQAAAPTAPAYAARPSIAGGGAAPRRAPKLRMPDPLDEESERDADLPRKRGLVSPPPHALRGSPVEVVLKTCSDTSSRPLAQRSLLWQKRLRTATNASELIERYDTARAACELGDWRAERTFLELMQRRIDNGGTATVVLGHFTSRPDVQKHLAKLVLRRAVDPQLVSAVERAVFGSAVNWVQVDAQLSELGDLDKRITKLREEMAKAPDDPNGGIRLVKLLTRADRKDEAVSLGRRLRDQGLLTPTIARQLGDVLARAGHGDEAVRTYSEIVEFDPESVPSRRLLGDIYLGHGWYEPAYRQYKTITELDGSDALGWLRLAAAAAGTGRIDEALRLERKVAGAQGTPGPNDPRRWARLASAARLARLLSEPAAGGKTPMPTASVKRELKELGLFSGPGKLVIVTWEELSTQLELAALLDGSEQKLGEVTDASPIGLSAMLLTLADGERVKLSLRLLSEPLDNALGARRHEIVWDGKDFRVTVSRVELEPLGKTVSL